ncbi:MAG: DMT family transporter [Pseudomonadota bacterium]
MDIAAINWLRIAALGVIWGAAFMVTSLALAEDLGPLTIVAVRLGMGAAFLVMLSYALGHGLPRFSGPGALRLWLFILALALFSNAVPFALLSWGQQVVAAGFAGVCMAVVPLLVLPLAHVLIEGERMTWRRSVGFGMGTIGVFILIGPEAFKTTGAAGEGLAQLACVGAAFCYAVGSIFTRLCPPVNLIALAAATLLVAAIVFVPYAIYTEGLPAQPGALGWVALIYLGVLPTGIAQILLVQVIKEAGPIFMSLVNYQVPIWSVIFGTIVLNEALPPSLFLALIMILSGVALSQAGALKRLFSSKLT